MRATSTWIPDVGWVKCEQERQTASNSIAVIDDIESHYSESLGTQINSRKHLKSILRERGLRMCEMGEQVKTRRTPYKVTDSTKRLQQYIRRNGVNWNVVEKHCPELLPRR